MPEASTLAFLATAVLLASAVVTDLRSRRIPDRLTLPAVAAGLVLHAVAWGWSLQPGLGLAWSLAGAVAAPLPFLLFELALPGAFGGGDLKLLAALGALMGLPLALETVVRVALAGGLLGAAALVAGRLRSGKAPPAYVPYGVAIAAGAAWTAWSRLS